MKKLLLLLIIPLFIACEKEVDLKKEFKSLPTDMISIKPAVSTNSNAQKVKAEENNHLSALEIVKQTTLITTPPFERSFADEQRDTISEPPRLLMWATDIIMLDGELQTGWIEAVDIVFVRCLDDDCQIRDTIAYIPNSVLRSTEQAIREAYEAQDIEACYDIFDNAYRFTPITGEEWRALKINTDNDE